MWRNDGRTEWRTKQTLNAPLPFYGGGIKKVTMEQKYINCSCFREYNLWQFLSANTDSLCSYVRQCRKPNTKNRCTKSNIQNPTMLHINHKNLPEVIKWVLLQCVGLVPRLHWVVLVCVCVWGGGGGAVSYLKWSSEYSSRVWGLSPVSMGWSWCVCVGGGGGGSILPKVIKWVLLQGVGFVSRLHGVVLVCVCVGGGAVSYLKWSSEYSSRVWGLSPVSIGLSWCNYLLVWGRGQYFTWSDQASTPPVYGACLLSPSGGLGAWELASYLPGLQTGWTGSANCTLMLK